MLQDWVGGKVCWLYFWNTPSTRSGECWRWRPFQIAPWLPHLHGQLHWEVISRELACIHLCSPDIVTWELNVADNPDWWRRPLISILQLSESGKFQESTERRLSYWTRPWVLKANRKPTEEETYKVSALVCKLLNEWRKLHVHYRGTAITKGKTPIPVCWPKISLVGRGWYLDGWPSRLDTLCCTPCEDRLA